MRELDESDLFAIRSPAYLASLADGPDDCLSIVVEEATGRGPLGRKIAGPSEALNDLIAKSRSIEPGPGDRLIEIRWEKPISYVVTDETFSKPELDSPAPRPGWAPVAKVVMGGRFDTFLKESKCITDEWPAPRWHYSIVTLLHYVDVIATDKPKLRLLRVHGEELSDRSNGPEWP